jgi:hypothetical protein
VNARNTETRQMQRALSVRVTLFKLCHDHGLVDHAQHLAQEIDIFSAEQLSESRPLLEDEIWKRLRSLFLCLRFMRRSWTVEGEDP